MAERKEVPGFRLIKKGPTDSGKREEQHQNDISFFNWSSLNRTNFSNNVPKCTLINLLGVLNSIFPLGHLYHHQEFPAPFKGLNATRFDKVPDHGKSGRTWMLQPARGVQIFQELSTRRMAKNASLLCLPTFRDLPWHHFGLFILFYQRNKHIANIHHGNWKTHCPDPVKKLAIQKLQLPRRLA